ncbi:MAG: hypothetical protein JO170_03360 [Verrucomicrobia bacterium]|nr:hypothetical protein [Verrucomicrobiota bacterium]
MLGEPLLVRKASYKPRCGAYAAYKCGQQTAADTDYHAERTKKEKANRKLREILVETDQEPTDRCDDVRAIVEHSNAQIRLQLLAFGNLLAPKLVGKNPAEAKTVIDAEVRKVLTELSEYDPQDYYRWAARREKSLQRISLNL